MAKAGSSSDGSSADPVILTPYNDTPSEPTLQLSPPVTTFNSPPPKLTQDGGTQDGSESSDESKSSTTERLDPKLIGMSSGLKHLYSGNEDKKGRFKWQTTIPKDIGKPAEDAETQKWAVLVRHVKVYNDPEKVLEVHSIVIQSPLLKEVLKGVMKGYPGVTVGLQRLEFAKLCEPLIHRWPELNIAVEELRTKVANEAGSNGEPEASTNVKQDGEASKPDEDDAAVGVEQSGSELRVDKDASDTKEASSNDSGTKKGDASLQRTNATKLAHAELLQNLLATEFKDVLDSTQDIMSKGVIIYDYIWTLFQPATLIYTRIEGQERVCRLYSGRYGLDRDNHPGFWVMMHFVDYNGTEFGYQKVNTFIKSWTGTRIITALPAYPIGHHKNEDDLRARLIARGAKLEALKGSHYKAYDGIGWRLNNWGEKEKVSIRGRIMVDTLGWNKNVPNHSVYVTPFNKEARALLSSRGSSHSWDNDHSDDDIYDHIMEDGVPVDGHFVDEDEDLQKDPLTEEQKLLCTHLVRGYALKQKQWLNLYINSVSDLTFNADAFNSLVISDSLKELILGFTSSQQTLRHQFDDVIEGKGRGIILLLCGPPGVGKTLTAESVAEEMKVPLFVMSAGDVGYDSSSVEGRLLDLFEMVTRWNAVLLLDEADVFLEERSLHEMERNKIVSIFLRVLEYYEGIMFLTTNRVSTLDQAFQSRIHISLDYPELSMESRRQIWTNFLDRHNAVQQAAREKGPKRSTTNTDADQPDAEAAVAAALDQPCAEHVEDVSKPPPDAAPSNPENPEAPKRLIKTLTDLTDPLVEILSDSSSETAPSVCSEDIAQHESLTQPHTISARDIDALARLHMNGRQIKNVLKTAQLLAQKRGEGLSKRHIQTVLEVTQHLHNTAQLSERNRSSIFS